MREINPIFISTPGVMLNESRTMYMYNNNPIKTSFQDMNGFLGSFLSAQAIFMDQVTGIEREKKERGENFRMRSASSVITAI